LEDFDDVFQRALGFPSFYGRNMDAWIDCKTSVDAAADGLTTVRVLPGEILILEIGDPLYFRSRCPEQYAALIECSAFVNFRRREVGEPPVLALMPLGRADKLNAQPA
jgi:RNAse (barnase) inhibitor barstar